MIDQLKLFRGEGYKINDKILIRQPTLEEIVDFGEQRYFGLVRTICSKSGTNFMSSGRR